MQSACACRTHGRGRACSRWAPLPVLILLVALILWCTPLPNKVYYSCDRPCHDLEWPMICRFKVTVEAHCPANLTVCESGTRLRDSPLVANRMIPGPTLKVCENDIVVVDLVNLAMGQSMALHWGGQSQRRDPYMDGVPLVTQCPVNALNSFQYKFRATGTGTHLWSATGSPYTDAVFGALIVRQSAARDPHSSLYDEDQHVFSLTVYKGAILINGQVNHEVTPLVPGLRYRFRLLYSGPGDLPLVVGLLQHDMQLIALDGEPVQPRLARSLTLRPGERVDVVVRADRPQGTYPLEVRAEGAALAPARTLLQYTPQRPPDKKAKSSDSLTAVADAPLKEAADIENFHDIEGLGHLPEQLEQDEVDVRLYLPFRNDAGSKPGFCNISMVLPAAPLLSQLEDAEAASCSEGCSSSGAPLCRGEAEPAAVEGEGEGTECTHIIRLPRGSAVEIVLADQGGEGSPARSTFHLHGHSFWVVGEAPGPPPAGPWQALAAADQRGALLHRKLTASRRRDTVSVPRAGIVALRFVADNPGYWLLREKSFYQRPAGLGVILQVGDAADLPPVPRNFPKCGSFVGPDFFLI